jgi:hypothetical protein
MLDHYDGCLIRALFNIYPEYPWQVWRFKKVPKGFWDDVENVREYFEWLGKSFGVTHLDDWYGYVCLCCDEHVMNIAIRITGDRVSALRGGTLKRKAKGMFQVLCRLYPGHRWNAALFKPL